MSRLVLWAAALGLVTTAALPASSADLKVAVVDIGRLLADSPQWKAAQLAIESEFGPKQRELENRDKELKARFEKYQRDSVAMSEAERDKQEKELRDAQRDLERRAQEFRDDAQSRGRSETQRVQKIIFDEIKAYSKANTYDLVLTGGLQGGVLDYKETLDITTAVLAQLQAKYRPTTAPVPQQPATQPKPPAKTN
ncbi:MAG TPA: OmpH family outer membrane protein [Steroidobacteraceae bacterium]|nr:OmpH family outer membrane protein [Steroidobacteraceae bacterium]